jgi:hypothetical protein
MLFRSQPASTWREEINSLLIWIAALAVVVAAVVRYAAQPTFWLDEAFVAVSLRDYSPRLIFAPLEYGQVFPRLYLFAIAILREVLGYHIWVVRLLPLLCFTLATFFWARLLARRSKSHAVTAVLGALLLIGATLWLDQAIQLKQYTFDVAVALIPFLVGDEFFEESLVKGRHKAKLAALSLPCLLSYSYPMAIGARLLGWYLFRGRQLGWRIRASAGVLLGVSVTAALVGLWFTDHRFNVHDRAAYLEYWNDCILGSCLQHDLASSLRLLARFLWGWHGRQPLVTAGILPLQILGVYSVISSLKNRGPLQGESGWGSRSLGSLVLLGGVILASALLYYPICGRVVLFTQIHTQILAIEGAMLVLSSWSARRAARVILCILALVIAFHSAREYLRFVRSEPAENLQPALAAIKPEVANMVWVHPCSVAQVRSLPEPISVREVVFGSEQEQPPAGEKIWVLWSHLGNETCVSQLEHIRLKARSWQVVHEGPGRGLALAEF